jgi:transposase
MAAKQYPPEVKERGVRLVREARRLDPSDRGVISRVARQLNVGAESLRTWVKQADIDTGEKPGVTTQESACEGTRPALRPAPFELSFQGQSGSPVSRSREFTQFGGWQQARRGSGSASKEAANSTQIECRGNRPTGRGVSSWRVPPRAGEVFQRTSQHDLLPNESAGSAVAISRKTRSRFHAVRSLFMNFVASSSAVIDFMRRVRNDYSDHSSFDADFDAKEKRCLVPELTVRFSKSYATISCTSAHQTRPRFGA